MGWLIGLKRNPNKKFLIYYPHQIPNQGWKWTVGVTPHATFYEDIVFGDHLSSIERQNTNSYWSSIDSIFSEPPSPLLPHPLHENTVNSEFTEPEVNKSEISALHQSHADD